LLRERKLLSFFSFRASREFSRGSEERLTGGAKKISKLFFASIAIAVRVSGVGNRSGFRDTALRQRRLREQQVVHFENTGLRVHCERSQWVMGGIDDHRPGFFSFSSRQRNPRGESVPILVLPFFLHQGPALLE